MGANQFKGKWNQLKSELRETWVKFTNDDLIQIDGDYEKLMWLVQQRYADRKDEVRRWVDEWYRSQTQEPVGQSGRK